VTLTQTGKENDKDDNMTIKIPIHFTQLYTWYLFSFYWIIVSQQWIRKTAIFTVLISSSNQLHQFRAAAQCFGDLHHYRMMMEAGKFPKCCTSVPSWHNFSLKN